MRSVAFRRGHNVGIINTFRRDRWMQPQVAGTLAVTKNFATVFSREIFLVVDFVLTV